MTLLTFNIITRSPRALTFFVILIHPARFDARENPGLFTREIGVFEFSFAIGETLAHLNYLVGDGLLERCHDDDGLIRYRRAA